MDGLALDFWLEGVDGKRLWETIKAKNCGGIGHYGGKTVHFDAGRPRFWEAATSGTRAPGAGQQPASLPGHRADPPLRGPGTRPAVVLQPQFLCLWRAANRAALPCLQSAATGCQCPPRPEHQAPSARRSATARWPTRSPAQLPANTPPGRYLIKTEFCDKPFPQMPSETFSNPIELHR